MTVHILKLCVGVDSVEDLKAFQSQRLAALAKENKIKKLVHKTRQMPKRIEQLQDGGSIYWVIKGAILVRQTLLSIEQGLTKDGRSCCELSLDPNLVLVHPSPRRPFQGWRYLKSEDAPPDLSQTAAEAMTRMPEDMRRKLQELALI